ncbi:threonine/serine exporter ThrE family protein [Knoellia sp. p5-6-4]|uniref:threonine/serine ThrE exporter family protein n=1 Tax=unclassified Knoellia TaxID=2618719 RepID=UPI0023DBC52F|nr:threonine/serine exporter family protein [Knoellia sp. p5-6-4]MDF2145481.1 threonine/serine exporter family protein [Knoellia sp. p5-6-4]
MTDVAEGPASQSSLPERRALPRRPRVPRGLWRGEELTETLPIADSLRLTPYRNPRVLAAAAEEREARASLDLALRVGELMLRCGAGAPQVESSVTAVAAAAGLDNLEVDITLQSLLVQCTTSSGGQITMLRVVRSATRDFARLVAVHEFVENLVAGSYDREAAAARLREIRRMPRFWPRWVVHGSMGVLSAAVAIMLGASLSASLVAGVSAVFVDSTARRLGARGLPEFYQCAIGGFIATAIAWGAFSVGAAGALPVSSADFAYIVAGGIVVLLPGRTVASAFEDVISGYSVTGAGRMFGVLLTTAGIILGVAAALSMTLKLTAALDLSLASPSILELRATDAPVVLGVLGAIVVGLAGAVSLRSRRELVLPTGLLCGAGVGLSLVVSLVPGLGALTAAGLASIALGFVGRLVALRMGAPAMVLVVPASYGLLPGLAIFRGLYEMVTHASADAGSLSLQGGITTLLGAFAVLLAIATGTTLGELLGAPFDHRMVQKRRARRR